MEGIFPSTSSKRTFMQALKSKEKLFLNLEMYSKKIIRMLILESF